MAVHRIDYPQNESLANRQLTVLQTEILVKLKGTVGPLAINYGRGDRHVRQNFPAIFSDPPYQFGMEIGDPPYLKGSGFRDPPPITAGAL